MSDTLQEFKRRYDRISNFVSLFLYCRDCIRSQGAKVPGTKWCSVSGSHIVQVNRTSDRTYFSPPGMTSEHNILGTSSCDRSAWCLQRISKPVTHRKRRLHTCSMSPDVWGLNTHIGRQGWTVSLFLCLTITSASPRNWFSLPNSYKYFQH